MLHAGRKPRRRGETPAPSSVLTPHRDGTSVMGARPKRARPAPSRRAQDALFAAGGGADGRRGAHAGVVRAGRYLEHRLVVGLVRDGGRLHQLARLVVLALVAEDALLGVRVGDADDADPSCLKAAVAKGTSQIPT